MKVAVVGATGMVGEKMRQVLAERKFPVTTFIPVASARSVGKQVPFNGNSYPVVGLEEAVDLKPDIALFSAGGATALEWAPKFTAKGTIVIDNSSAWRMHPDVPLIVPEVNGHTLKSKPTIIANPNCSTIQMVMVLQPLHQLFTIERVVVSTYQSVTGTGVKAVTQLMNERQAIAGEMAYKYPIDLNLIPQIDVFTENGYTKEEMKMVLETCKIMEDESIKVTATTVRVPVIGGHSESVNITFAKPFDLEAIYAILQQTPGIVVQDNLEQQLYPMPLMAHDKDEVFVGRIRRDFTQPNALNCWIVADNLRKGAATNAVQIAKYLLDNGLV